MCATSIDVNDWYAVIGIIDYGMGNLHSVQKGFEHIGASVRVVTDGAGIDDVDKVVLPGVGAFRDAIATLHDKRLVDPILRSVEKGKWFLGICLGMQLLFDMSYEGGQYNGLGVISGCVKRFDFTGQPDEKGLKIPHMGWNSLTWTRDLPLYKGIENGCYVYFVHSYYVIAQNVADIATTTQHGIDFVSSIARDNVMATQFHPEKSQHIGLAMLKNFAELK